MTSIELEITRELTAPVDRVFEAWTHPELMQRWFAPGPMRVAYVEAQVRVCGEYQIVMEDEGGTTHTVSGIYKKIEPNKQLIFSWQWYGSEDIMEVSLIFSQLTSHKTKMTLLHTGFVIEETKVKHSQGWHGCLDKLSNILN